MSNMPEDTKTLLRSGGGIFSVGALSAALAATILGGLGPQGPHTNSGWLAAATFTYTYTDNHTPGYNASIPLLSPSIAKSIFKKKNGEIRLTTFDLLNANVSVNKSVSVTGYSESRTATLSRYLMLTMACAIRPYLASCWALPCSPMTMGARAFRDSKRPETSASIRGSVASSSKIK